MKIRVLVDWIDERTAWSSLWAGYAERPIEGGASWAYVFASGLKFVFATQLLTGLLMLLYYVPSVDHAHTTVAYIQKEVFLGYLVRGFHFYGANTLFILLLLHLLQTLLWGAYKAKRELVWISGLLMLGLVQGFLFTGYLLPWDQKSYFGTKVALSIVSSIPALGETLERVAMGGERLSTLTLSRFFVIHVLVLPLLFLTLLAIHVYLARRAGAAGSFNGGAPSAYYPGQFFRNATFVFLLFLVLGLLSHKAPVILEPMADPTDTAYIARPEWYFLPLFQMLKYFPGRLAIIPGLILPGLLVTGLMLLPFFDRGVERNPRRRPLVTAMLFVTGLSLLSLFTMAKFDDYRDETTMRQLLKQHKQAQEFLMEPFEPQPIGGVAVRVCPPSPFLDNCVECHGDAAEGSKKGPKLIGVTKKRGPEELVKLLKDPQAYGLSEDMPEFSSLSDEELQQIVDYLKALER